MSTRQNILLLFVTLITVQIGFTQITKSGVLKDLDDRYPDLDISTALQEFQKALVQQEILNSTEIGNATSIYDKLQKALPTLDPSELEINYYMVKAPFDEFMATQDILSFSQNDQALIALFTYYQLVSEKHRDIRVHLDEKRLLSFKNQDLPIMNMEAVIFEEIAEREHKGINTQNARVVISADPYTDYEFVQFIMAKFGEIGIRQVKFERIKQ